MSTTYAQVIAAIAASPAGITTVEIAETINGTTYNVSGIVSRLFRRGKIGRKAVLTAQGPRCAWKPIGKARV